MKEAVELVINRINNNKRVTNKYYYRIQARANAF
jgi:hypothetical protein